MEKQLASRPPPTPVTTTTTTTTTTMTTTTSIWNQPNAKLKIASSSAPQARNYRGGDVSV